MKALSLLFVELKSITKRKALLFSAIGALLIPVIYCAIQLSATWGPYDNLSNLPVAVVNNDNGTMIDNESINVGNDLVEDLQGNPALNWSFVSTEEANKGLENLSYYLIIEIPENFSSNLTTVLDDNPQKMELKYIQNEGLNFLAAQVTRAATEKIKEGLANKITEKYAMNVFGSIDEVAQGFQAASDGSKQIHDGTAKVYDGTTEMLTSLQEKAPDITKLANGAEAVNDGAVKILTSLNEKSPDISRLANGAKQVHDGTSLLLNKLKDKEKDIEKLAHGAKSLEEGSISLHDGITQVLVGLKDAKTGADQLEQGTANLVNGSVDLSNGVERWQGGAADVAGGATRLAEGMEEYLKYNPHLQLDPNFQKLVEGSKALAKGTNDLSASTTRIKNGVDNISNGLQKVNTGNSQLASGLTQLVDGQTKIQSGSSQLSDGTSLVAGGTSSVNSGWKELIQGVSQLQGGTEQLSGGTSSLETGWNELTDGVARLQNGTEQVKDGTASVESGWGSLTDGVTQLNNGANQLKGGSQELYTRLNDAATETGDIKVSDPNYQMFASPVETVEEIINPFPEYRNSTAPYHLSLALIIGMLIMSLIVNLTKPEKFPSSAFSWFASKFLITSILALIQAILVSIVTLGFLGLEVKSGLQFVIFTMITSLCFGAIVLFLVTLAGNLGRLIAFGFIALQLGTTGGQLPIELLPENLQNISVIAPLTYSIAGLKSTISLGNFGYILQNGAVLLGFLLIFSLLTFITILVKYKKGMIDQSSMTSEVA